VAEVNDKLSRLSSNVSAIDDDDQRRLLTYMPDTIDTIMIPRTLEAIAKEAEVVLKKVSSENVSVNSSSADGLSATNQTDQPKAAAFSMDVEGSYDQIKNLLRLLEQNEYPLEVKSLKITKVDDGFLNVGLTITTYSLQLPGEGASINEVTL
jgi:hypothetical protein